MANYSAESSVSGKVLTITRLFDASRELLFRTFTEPAHVARWWAPGGYTIPVCKIDLRPGGHWHYSMRSPEGDEHWVLAVYEEVVVPERIVYTATFADEHANSTDDIPRQYAILTFEQVDNRTRLTLRMEFETEEALKWTVEVGMIEGFTLTLEQLSELLPELALAEGNRP